MRKRGLIYEESWLKDGSRLDWWVDWWIIYIFMLSLVLIIYVQEAHHTIIDKKGKKTITSLLQTSTNPLLLLYNQQTYHSSTPARRFLPQQIKDLILDLLFPQIKHQLLPLLPLLQRKLLVPTLFIWGFGLLEGVKVAQLERGGGLLLL